MATVVAGSVTASATPLWVDAEPESVAGCSSVSADVIRWKPSDGAPAAFIADRFLDGEGNRLVILGADAGGIWTAETRSDDACGDECATLDLVHTSYSGARKTQRVADAQALRELSVEERTARIKQKLFGLASSPWKAPEWTQAYTLSFPRYSPEGQIERYTGWFAEVKVAGKPGMRFGVVSRSFMCWCSDQWNGYPLRA